ncbi:hypothetical protein VSX64_06850 [Aurantimonas sp. C2-6-R+9]|uniref:hypothetical protein n=1 Tax=unclassified Aurantimonas TaxID=2638230 RepID=UPI002E170663|nr:MULTISPECIES: hypothetical protein [unclassified Aurantimonas]MEC5290389.1 hypothetical protein [Aurantimonas sp. C2-3-R2]MEC5380603.1 hypothetical protein [Aurantimonas sp. C2-6-R+9]MEC5411557.1 hypothetical protein [Aurantimonas sp. C2-4-R8]
MVTARSGQHRRPVLTQYARRPAFSLFVGVLAVLALVLSGLGHGAAAGPMAMTECGWSAVQANAPTGDETGRCFLNAAAIDGEADAGQALLPAAACPQHAPCVHFFVAPERPLLRAQGSNRVIATVSDPLRERTESPPHHPPIS